MSDAEESGREDGVGNLLGLNDTNLIGLVQMTRTTELIDSLTTNLNKDPIVLNDGSLPFFFEFPTASR
jgi:hypothetical protein